MENKYMENKKYKLIKNKIEFLKKKINLIFKCYLFL